jgi:formylglycine-generating enzyme required for sulfatase activity
MPSIKFNLLIVSFFIYLLIILSSVASSDSKIKFQDDKNVTNSIGMKFVLIPAGQFMMGSDKATDPDAFIDELPAHLVTISKPFYMGQYEVTQGQWTKVMGQLPTVFALIDSSEKSSNHPIVLVTWEDAVNFVTKLNQNGGNR